MSTTTTPINLTNYEITEGNITKAEVETSLRNSMTWLKANQSEYYKNNLSDLADKAITEGTRISGSLNSMGRKLGITPSVPAPYQAYNMAEMFRTTVLMKAIGYIQNHALYEVISKHNTEPTVGVVLAEFKLTFPHLKTPKQNYIQRTITTIYKSGVIQGDPSADGVLPFWATDTHYSKVTRANRDIFFTFKVEGTGPVTLKFILPAGERFTHGKLTRPTVFLGKKNELRFGFTLQTEAAPPRKTTSVLALDLGRIEPAVGVLITGDTYSQPLFTNKQVNLLTAKIKRLGELTGLLWAKEKFNEAKGHTDKQALLRAERLRVRSKIARLRVERVHRVSTQYINIAVSHNATILLENLTWVPQSSWEQSQQQTAITDAATRHSLPHKKVNPKNTSQLCPRCRTQVTHSKRMTSCPDCKHKLDRDILATRNIGVVLSGVRFADLSQTRVKAILPRITRCAEPVTTGAKQPNYATNTT